MGNTNKKLGKSDRIRPYQGSEKERLLKVEKQAFVACVASVAALPSALLGFGLILGIVGLVLGIKAVRPDGKRPVGAIVAIVFGILSIIVGVFGCIVLYGVYINPGSEFVQNFANILMKLFKLG